MDNLQIDVAIIGAAVGGAATAYHCEQAGLSCALIDRAQFPRRKTCGEGLSILGFKELSRLGLAGKILSLPHVPFRGFQFHDQTRSDALELFSSHDDQFHGLGISRYELDNALIGALQSSIVDLGTEPEVSESSDGGFIVRTEARTYKARYLVLANGARQLLAQSLGVPTHVSKSFRCGVSVRVRTKQPARGLVEIFLQKYFQACWTWTDTHEATVCFVSEGRHASALRASLIRPLLKEFCNTLGIEAEIIGEIQGVSGIGQFSRPFLSRRIFLVGDAVQQLHPIGGMGMTQALMGARITAHTIAKLTTSSPHLAKKIEALHVHQMRRSARFVRGYTQLAYLSLVNPVGRRTIGLLRTGSVARAMMNNMHRVETQRFDMVASTLLFVLGNL